MRFLSECILNVFLCEVETYFPMSVHHCVLYQEKVTGAQITAEGNCFRVANHW